MFGLLAWSSSRIAGVLSVDPSSTTRSSSRPPHLCASTDRIASVICLAPLNTGMPTVRVGEDTTDVAACDVFSSSISRRATRPCLSASLQSAEMRTRTVPEPDGLAALPRSVTSTGILVTHYEVRTSGPSAWSCGRRIERFRFRRQPALTSCAGSR